MALTNIDVLPASLAKGKAREAPRRLRRAEISRRTATRALIALILVVEIYPLFWLVSSSLKSETAFVTQPLWDLPTSLDFNNYSTAWSTAQLGTDALNSITVTLSSVVAILVLGSCAAFALGVMVWRGRAWALLFIVGGLMVPAQLILLPLFEIYFKIGVNDTLLPMVITYIGEGLPLTVFLMATYFRSVPQELFEACVLDGGGAFRCFFSVGLPLVRNGMFTVGMLMFFSVFNDLLVALTFNTKPSLSTVQVGLLNFDGQYGQVAYGPLLAAISIVILAMLVLYLALNKQIMRGISAGAVKG
ncbi:MAG TPA: carbohydrate ABC transporter permease [Acidimicrobiales bacterium]|nr:carbohydrate ABC transporter permease [Acidimicrobiales bacterium]